MHSVYHKNAFAGEFSLMVTGDILNPNRALFFLLGFFGCAKAVVPLVFCQNIVHRQLKDKPAMGL